MTHVDRLAYAIGRELRGHPALVDLLAKHIGADAAIPAARKLTAEFARTLAATMEMAGWRPRCLNCGRAPQLVCDHCGVYEEASTR